MNSLVGYGVSSGSEDEDEPQSGAAKNEQNECKPRKSRNLLVESGSASSESSSASEREEEKEEEPSPVNLCSSPEHTLPPTAFNKLPSPALGRFCVPPGTSVFANPFKEQAEQKLNVLQKHVPLTAHARPAHIGGKRMCVGYRKDGRCRFGIHCKFAHDSDLQQNVAEAAVSDLDWNNGMTSDPACRESTVERHGGDDGENQSRRKKHRVGVSDGLIPPKRALKQYAKQRNNVSHTHAHAHTKMECEK